LKFNSHKDAKTLMEAIEKRFGGNIETKKVQKTLLKQQFEKFTVSAAASVSAIYAKLPVSSLPNFDFLSHAIDVDDLEEIDLRWQMAMLTMRARRFLQKTGRNLGANGPTSMGFDMSKVKCYKCHRKGHSARESRSLRDSRRTGAAEPQRRTVPAETSTANALVSQVDGQIHDRLQRLVSQLEIHGVSLSLEDVNLKFLCSLPSEWKTHTLIWKNKADLEEQSLDDLFNSLKIYEAEVKHSSSTGTTTQNLAFVSSSNTDSTNDSVSAAASVYAVCAKLFVSSLLNIDSLSNAVIYSFFASQSTSPQLDNEDLKQIDVDDLEEMDLRWQMAMLTMQARRKCRSPKDSRRNGATEPQRRTMLVETSTSNALVFQCLESVEARLLVYKQNESVFEENIKLLNIEVQLRDTALVTLRQKLEKAEQERDDLKLKLEKFQTSSKNLTELLASQPNKKHGLGYNSQLSPFKPAQDLSHTNRPTAPIIEDWVSDSEDESETKSPQIVLILTQSKPAFITAVRPVSAVMPKIMVTRPRLAHQIVTKSKSPIRRYITHSQSPKTSNSPPRVTAVQAPVFSAA
nr:hypothetical protein [Tanacetum cinerariifolium]